MFSLMLLAALAVFLVVTPDELVKDRQIWAYGRISTKGQKKSLATQETTLRDFAKEEMKSKISKGRLYSEQKSGTTLDRKQLRKMIRDMHQFIDNGNPPPVILVKGAARFSRRPSDAWKILTPLKEKGVNMYSILQANYTGTKKFKNPMGEFLIDLGFGLGLVEVATTIARGAKAREVAIRQGRNVAGQFNYYNYSGVPIDWRKAIEYYWPMWKNGDISMNKAAKKIGLSDVGLTQQFQKGYKYEGKILPVGKLDFIKTNMEKQGRTLDEWVNVIDRILKLGKKYGMEKGNESWEFSALRRQASGYVYEPWKHLPPEDENSSVSVSAFQDYLANPKEYVSKFDIDKRKARKRGR